MELDIAVRLIKPGVTRGPGQRWYDLGAGSGLFTRAIGSLLVSGEVIAVDKDLKEMSAMPKSIGAVRVSKTVADFSAVTLHDRADGIVMANALHFVEDKKKLLTALRSVLKAGGRLIVIEYEMTKPNSWVPFPVNFSSLSSLAAIAGFINVSKIGETTSKFQKNGIYSAMLSD